MNLYVVWSVLGVVALVILGGILFRFVGSFRRSKSLAEVDLLEGHAFEHYCAKLLRENGFIEVEVTKGSGDFGIDILAEKDEITYAIQCKRYQEPVGVKAIQEAYSGKDYYDRMVGAVMTNQYFTSAGVTAARKLKILMWDREYLEDLMSR